METIKEIVREGHRRRIALSVAEAAIEVGVGRDQVYSAIRDGRLEARKWGRRTLITCSALQRFLNGLPPLQLPPAAPPHAQQGLGELGLDRRIPEPAVKP